MKFKTFAAAFLTVSAGLFSAPLFALDFGPGRWVDLSHVYSDKMVTFPRSKQFEHQEGFIGVNRGGIFMATYNYASSEHTGTHLDAPVHFHEGGKSIDQLPFDVMMGEVFVIDVREQVSADQEYLVSVEDVLAFEAEHGKIPTGAIVMFNTGLSNVWPNAVKYIGTDKRGNEGVAEMKNPGIHEDAARLLAADRGIKSFGIDSISFDNKRQPKSNAHRAFFERGVPGVENMANLDKLPPTGAYLIGLPMNIKDGSAAPIRIIAFIPDQL